MIPICSMCLKATGPRPFIAVGHLVLGRDCAKKIGALPPARLEKMRKQAADVALEADFKARQMVMPL